jgi:uncharacterized protein (TIGR03382 family)
VILAVAAALARPDALGSVEAERHPIRCHFEVVSDRSRCVTLLTYADLAWDVQVDTLGFAAPLPDGDLGGDDLLDIYLGTSVSGGAGEAWVDCDGGDGTCTDADPTDGRAGAPSFVVIDARTSDADLPGYMVHEFNHTTQYATDYAEPFLSVWEGTAVSAEMWTLPDVDPSISDIADYQATPWVSAVLQDGYFLEEEGLTSWYEYGAMVWVRWYDARYGDGSGTSAAALWRDMTQEGYGTEPDVLDVWVDWETDLLAFAADRARMGTTEGPAWLTFAGERAAVTKDGTLTLGSFTPSRAPYPLGAVYWDIPAGFAGTVSLDGDPAVRWGMVVVGAVPTETTDTVLSVHGPATLGVVNLGPAGFDADDPLAPADFRLDVTENPEDAGCGCNTTIAAPWLGVFVLGLMRRRSALAR